MSKELDLPSLKKAEIYKTNPFVLDLKGKMYLQPRANTIIAKGESIVNHLTGEVKNDVLMGTRKIVDKTQFAKVYVSELGVLMDLSKKAINVLIYLMQKMDYENKAFFNYTSDHLEVGYKSDVPALNGIRELLKNNIIAVSNMPHFYWINPIYVCKGERFAKYTEYVTEEYAEKEKQQMFEMQRAEKQQALNEIHYKKDAMDSQETNDLRRKKDLENELRKLEDKINGTHGKIQQYNIEGGIDYIE